VCAAPQHEEILMAGPAISKRAQAHTHIVDSQACALKNSADCFNLVQAYSQV
jgi:hypothetical protein